MTEEQALRHLKRGSQAALEWFIDRYGGYVTAIIRGIIGQSMTVADVEEAASDVFLAFWNSAGRVHSGSAKAYLAATEQCPEQAAAADTHRAAAGGHGAGGSPDAPETAGAAGAGRRCAAGAAGDGADGQGDISAVLLLLPEDQPDRCGHGAEGEHCQVSSQPGTGKAESLTVGGGRAG